MGDHARGLGSISSTSASDSTSSVVGDTAFAVGRDAGVDPDGEGAAWWNTPASQYLLPRAVNPAIYGIDADDVGVGIPPQNDRGQSFEDLFRDKHVSAKPMKADQAPLRLDQGGTKPTDEQKKDGTKRRPPKKAQHAQAPAAVPAQTSAPEPAAATAREPRTAPESTVQAFLGEGRSAHTAMASAFHQANALYNVVHKLSIAKATQEKNTRDYKDASKVRDEMLEVSTFEKVLTGVSAVIQFGISVSNVVSAARTIYSAAKEMREVGKLTKQLGDATDAFEQLGPASRIQKIKTTSKNTPGGTLKAVGRGAKDGIAVGKRVGEMAPDGSDEMLDPETMLADTNASAIEAASTALIGDGEARNAFGLTVVHGFAKSAGTHFLNMVVGISQLNAERLLLSPTALTQYKASVDEFGKLNEEYLQSMERVAALLRAYEAGGSAGLADAKELSLFETLQRWVAAKDPKANDVHFALDQDNKQIRFEGLSIQVDAELSGSSTTYSGYRYSERLIQSEDATIYATGAAIGELHKLGLPMAKATKVGAAEMVENKKGGFPFTISASIAKAIESLGIEGSSNPAIVQLVAPNAASRLIQSKHNGPWFENWIATPEFVEFWRSDLGGEYGYVVSGDGERKTIPAAKNDHVIMNRSANRRLRQRL